MLVFTLFEGVEPGALIWQPEYGVITAVILDDAGEATETDAAPGEETEVEDDEVAATPAA